MTVVQNVNRLQTQLAYMIALETVGETTVLSPRVNQVTHPKLSQSPKTLEFSSVNKLPHDRIFLETNVIVHRVSDVDFAQWTAMCLMDKKKNVRQISNSEIPVSVCYGGVTYSRLVSLSV